MSNVIFKASFVAKTNIYREITTSKRKANIVELDKLNPNDIEVLKYIANNWENNNYCADIYKQTLLACSDQEKTYALTTQQKNFEVLKPNEIQGVMHSYRNYWKNTIKYLEAKDANSKNREYKGVGSALIKFMQTNNRCLELQCLNKKIIENFYKPLGFIQKFPNMPLSLIWKNENSFLKTCMKLISKVFG